MSRPCESKPVALSAKIYRRLLVAYPRNHRLEYGEPMAHLFRDQCHDAWASGRGWGLAVLWLRVLVDLAETSIKEHLGNLKQRIAMFSKVRLIVRDNPMARTTFRRLFAGVLVLAVGFSAGLAFLMPKKYMSNAVVAVGHRTDNTAPGFYVKSADPDLIATHCKAIQSQTTLRRVGEQLNLTKSWEAGREPVDIRKRLNIDLEVRPVQRSNLIDIRVTGREPGETTLIANVLSKTYCEATAEQQKRQLRDAAGNAAPYVDSVRIVDAAVRPFHAIRPRKVTTLFLGALGGSLLAYFVGGIGVLVANRRP